MIVLGTQPLGDHRADDALGDARGAGRGLHPHGAAKGLSNVRVIALHAFRNALIPVITVIGLQVGVLFTGAILTETIFSWPGVGKWLIEAINRRDYPVLQGGLLMLGTIVMVVNLLVDVAYGIINPRIRARRESTAESLATSPVVAPPGPLREFWGYFSANHGAVAGLVVVIAVLLDGQRSPTCSRPTRRI